MSVVRGLGGGRAVNRKIRTFLAAAAGIVAVLAVVAALERLTPSEQADLDTLRGIEPRSAEGRAACASLVLGQVTEALNSGDRETLLALFDDAATPVHSFVLAGPKLDLETTDGRAAAEALLARGAAGERWRVERVTANAGPSWHGAIDVRVVIARDAPDLPRGGITASGAGVVSCVSGKVVSLRLAG